MSILATTLQVILLIAVVLTLFNIIIFVHELGHFWAAKWRGLQIDRFQIWFGKPLWKKEINGVQYGLGWIPAGGFVALPQMAPMEAIEGGEKPEKPLPPITPLDKIIVAFAGPLFSMLLALASALVVWQVGKPKDFVPTQIVGEVKPGSPAEKAGIRAGDKVLSINGEPVNGFAGTLDSIFESVVLSSGPQIEFLIERPGVAEPLRIVSSFETEPAKWYQRRGIEAVIDRSGKTLTLTLHAQKPLKPAGADPILGVSLFSSPFHDKRIVHPGPLTQVSESLRMMWTTLAGLVTPSSNIGVDHLSGPVGIAKMQYKLLQMEDGWRRILAFMVLFNVNLAVLNMLPFPVLDGGHITLALLEKITGRPVRAKPLEILQTICALMLISLMLFVTSKDIGDDFGRGSGKNSEVVFPAD
ncbi:MAG: site-2 protease family protein [Akkermansiaceae bacterium]|nr:site-2 protease family protein [Akkermansiaceae bacterium]